MWSAPLPDSPRALSRLRLEACTYLVAEGVGDELDDIAVVLSELVNNASTHGSAPQTAVIDIHDDVVHVEVEDANPASPEVPVDGALEEAGHGLRLVDALADSWGVEPRTPTGKAVWADFRCTRRAANG